MRCVGSLIKATRESLLSDLKDRGLAKVDLWISDGGKAMINAIVAMLYFRGNFSLASRYLFEHRYILVRVVRQTAQRFLNACKAVQKNIRIGRVFMQPLGCPE